MQYGMLIGAPLYDHQCEWARVSGRIRPLARVGGSAEGMGSVAETVALHHRAWFAAQPTDQPSPRPPVLTERKGCGVNAVGTVPDGVLLS